MTGLNAFTAPISNCETFANYPRLTSYSWLFIFCGLCENQTINRNSIWLILKKKLSQGHNWIKEQIHMAFLVIVHCVNICKFALFQVYTRCKQNSTERLKNGHKIAFDKWRTSCQRTQSQTHTITHAHIYPLSVTCKKRSK